MTHDQECALRHVQRNGWCPGCDDASARREARGMEVRLRERRSPDRLSERYVPWWFYAALALGWLYICVANAIQGEVWGAVGSAAVVVILVVIAVECYGDTKKVDDLPRMRLRERIMIGPEHDAAVAACALREAAEALDDMQTPDNDELIRVRRDPALWLLDRADAIERKVGESNGDT